MNTKKKVLQKFTHIVDENSLDEHMIVNLDPQPVLAYLINLVNKIDINTASIEWQSKAELLVYCAEKYGTKEQHKGFRNLLYNHNHIIIMAAIHNSIISNKIFPSITNVASCTGLSRTTIYNHLKDENKNSLETESRKLQRMLVGQAINKLYEIGMSDRNPAALREFLKFTMPTNTTTVNNYIQINNLRITKEELEQLPKGAIYEIEQIISKSLTNINGESNHYSSV